MKLMLARIVGLICLLIGDWYVIDGCFQAMTYPSDITFVGGWLGLVVLVWLNYVIVSRLFKKYLDDQFLN